MRDAAMALPLLVELAQRARSDDLGDKHVEDACKVFEDEMIPRTFEWVKKSGGDETIVSTINTMTMGSIDFKETAF